MSKGSTEQKVINRWIPVIAGIAIQLCLGTVYIWGVFQPAVVERFGWTQATASATFSFVLGFFVFGSIIGGKIQDRFGPRSVVMGGGVVLGIGVALAYFTTAGMPWWLWLSYGVIGGFGMGTTYTTIIACCQKWFPDRRGLITGMIVSAIGFGGVVFTPIARMLIASSGVMETFVWFSIIFAVVGIVGGMFINNPPAGYSPAGWVPTAAAKGLSAQNYTPGEMVKTRQFYMVTITLMFAAFPGLMVIPFAKVMSIQAGLTDSTATLAVMIISICNSFGRLLWAAVSDKLGRKNTILGLLVIASVSAFLLTHVESYTILILIGIVAFMYGGFLGVFPALTADFWGLKNMGMNYGLVLIGFGIAAVNSPFAGYIKDLTGSFEKSFTISGVACLAGAVIIFFLKAPKQSAEQPQVIVAQSK